MTRLQTITAAFLALALCSSAHGQPSDRGDQPQVLARKEYFVQQQAGEAIVVRIAAFEAEFVARLATAEGESLGDAGLPDGRMLPVFHYVAEPGKPRQIDVDVDATQITDRTEFELELIRLNVRDDRSARLANAYRLLSGGLETLEGGNIPTWTVRIQTLLQAGSLFSELGMEEMRLWCRIYAAHQVLHQLRDAQTARDWAEQVLNVPQIDRHPVIAFAAAKIRSSAMVGQGAATDPASSPLQRALEDTLKRAGSLGYRYEQALALEAGGVDLEEQGLPAPALQRFNQALAIAEEIGAADLAAAIREHIVAIHEEFGDIEASGQVLQDIETHLLETGEVEQLAINLLRQGRLLIASYHYAQAIDVLSRGVQLEQSSLTRIETELSLATALHESGRSEEALVHYTRGVIQPESGDFRRPSRVLDLASALDAMAAIHRQRGEFERVNEIRRAEEDYLSDGEQRARWAYGRALDQLSRHGTRSAVAVDRFDEAYRLGEGSWRSLALLRLCTLNDSDPRCRPAAVQSAFEAAQESGSQAQAAEAALVYTSLLSLRGETRRALRVADDQVETVLRSGQAPLGAWYWESRQLLFNGYIGLAMRDEGEAGGSGSLLALARARAADRGTGPTPAALDPAGLAAFLRSLPRDGAVLSYFLGRDAAHAWVGTRDGVRRLALPDPDAIRNLCLDLRRAIQGNAWGDFERLAGRLGAQLLDPLGDLLAKTVFIVAHGPLLGVPFDALALNGAPLAAAHSVVYLDRFPAGADPAASLRMPPPARVFLAGDPQDWSGDYPTRLSPSGEVRAVTGRFLGPGLHAIEGVALLLDEFDDPRLGEAELVHLALPGVVDLSPVRASSLFLSEAGRGEGRQKLDAAMLSRKSLGARLVFMSRTEFQGSGEALESRVDPASAALDAGAGAVIASIWDGDPRARAAFVDEFYDRLANTGDMAAALANTRRSNLAGGVDADWAGFFLTIR